MSLLCSAPNPADPASWPLYSACPLPLAGFISRGSGGASDGRWRERGWTFLNPVPCQFRAALTPRGPSDTGGKVGGGVSASLASQLQPASGLPTPLPQMPVESSCAPYLDSIHLLSELVSFISDLICISYKNPLIALKFKILVRNFPSGPVVKAPGFQCRGPSWRTKIPHAEQHGQNKENNNKTIK